jgi:U3 small nucleolar RNA-associated protein 13
MRIYALSGAPSDGTITTKLVRTIKPHATPVVVTAIDAASSLLATGGADGTVKIWDIRGGFVTHTFHGHSGVVSALQFFQVESEEVSAKSKKKSNQQRSVDNGLANLTKTTSYRLASGGEDGKIKIWDLFKRKSAATLDSHVSVVRSLKFSPARQLLLSGSRDKTAMLWDASTWELVSTTAVLETIESVGFLANEDAFFTAGETARVRLWESTSGKELTEEETTGSELDAILDVLHFANLPFLLSVHADQTLKLHSLAPMLDRLIAGLNVRALPVLRRISGNHDEIIDLAYIGERRDLLAIATNSEDIRIISLATTAEADAAAQSSQYFGADVAVLKGHQEIIITIDTDWSGHWLATGAKDNTAKLWRLDPEADSYSCYATFTGHAESIGAVALPNAVPSVGSKEHQNPLEHPPKFLITGSQDKTIKRWDISATTGKVPRTAYTRKAHDKDINAIETSFASQSPMFASASQDRTVRIWDVDSGEAMGVLRGHKRGVWSVAFSPPGLPGLTTTSEGGGASTSRGMVVTGSGDKTVRIWSLTDYSCLRTFEGHVNSVLKVIWLPACSDGKDNRGVQVASAAGDGLVKVWDAQNSECAATLDNHIDRVWALAVRPQISSHGRDRASAVPQGEDEAGNAEDDASNGIHGSSSLELVSGSADSTLTFWNDTTAETALQATTQATARIEQDQELQNHIRANNYREAIELALQLNHPKRLLELFSTVVNGPHAPGTLTGNQDVDEVLADLSNSQIWALLRRIRDWNANGRTFHVAQRVLYAMNCTYPKERLLSLQRRRPAAISSDDDDDDELVNAMSGLSTKQRAQSKESVKDVLDALKAYTDRHHSRHEKTADERYVLMWALQEMDDVNGGLNGTLEVTNGTAHDDVLMLDDA